MTRASRIAIIGTGGAGKNILERVKASLNLTGDLIHVNTDLNSIEASSIEKSFFLERIDKDYVLRMVDISSYDVIFLVSGLGGSAGNTVAPIIAEKAREAGKKVVAVVTTPFNFEGDLKRQKTTLALSQLTSTCDIVVTLSNPDFLKAAGNDKPFSNIFDEINGLVVKIMQKALEFGWLSGNDAHNLAESLKTVVKSPVCVGQAGNVITVGITR
jgi:cell division GTPase FtsZ